MVEMIKTVLEVLDSNTAIIHENLEPRKLQPVAFVKKKKAQCHPKIYQLWVSFVERLCLAAQD
jgi:hypothetical protein